MRQFKVPKNIKIGLKIFGMCIGLVTMLNSVSAIIKGNLPVSTTSDEFPTTYQSYIDKLKQIYPNATFKAVYTGLDWNKILRHESYEVKKGISLIPSSYSSVWKKDGKDTYMDGYFVIASKGAVAYVLDPRNSLYEREIFQFEGLSYNPNITTEVIEKVIVSSPMVGAYAKKYKKAGEWVDMDMSYAEIINKVGEEQGVSSVYIASRMIQETSGDIVNNGSVNGSNTTYPGIYNFFNIGSTPNSDGSGSVVNGLKYAKSQGWTTPYLSISGGVAEIKSSYIKYGQDTVYFQKFDVNNPYGNAVALAAYQYQTNIMAPTSESRISYSAYKKLDMLDTAFTFYIPVYNNMPEDPAPYPAGDTAKFVEDNTKVYLDDEIKNGTDEFNIRLSASSELDNIIYTIKEEKEGADNRTIMTRTKKGDGYDWDYVEIKVDGNVIKGYVWKEYVKEYNYIKVDGITLDKTEHTLEVEDTCTLNAIITPTEARFKEVIWTVADQNIATVNNGVITGVNPGTTVVTATTEDGAKTATCQITVTEKAQDIILEQVEYTFEVDEKIKPSVTLKNIESYELKVADEQIATIIEGQIQGLKAGETTVDIIGVGTDVVRTIKVTVLEKTYAINLDKEEYSVVVDEKVKPIVTLKNVEGYELKIADETIASIVDGEIQGLKAGETTLEVIGVGTDIVKTAKIIVLEKVLEIHLDKEEYIIEVNGKIKPIVILINIESYEAKIADETIASIVDGEIQGLKAGETTVDIIGVGTDIVKTAKIIVKETTGYKLHETLNLSENKIVTKIEPKTLVSEFKEKIELENLTLVIKDASGKELIDEDKIGTGSTLTFLKEDNTEYDKITVVIYGDVDGDGNVYAADYVKIKNYIMSEGTLSDISMIAADVSRDSKIFANDYVIIKNYIMGEGAISQ